MSAELIAKALGGHPVGSGWMARCPAHDDRTPSLSINDGEDGTVLVHCFANCSQEEVIEALRSMGLWPHNDGWRATVLRAKGKVTPKTTAHIKAALQIWKEGMIATGTLVEVYLNERGITTAIPEALRFHASLKHPSGEAWPAMVALVMRGGKAVAVHRTFLARDGKSKAPVEPQKMMLGPCGGGAVHLGEPDSLLMIGEGIETCLSAMQATGYPAWAALSTSRLRTIEIPANVTELIVLADGDAAGEAAAFDCAYRFERDGRRARLARAPQGLDFNDLVADQ